MKKSLISQPARQQKTVPKASDQKRTAVESATKSTTSLASGDEDETVNQILTSKVTD